MPIKHHSQMKSRLDDRLRRHWLYRALSAIPFCEWMHMCRCAIPRCRRIQHAAGGYRHAIRGEHNEIQGALAIYRIIECRQSNPSLAVDQCNSEQASISKGNHLSETIAESSPHGNPAEKFPRSIACPCNVAYALQSDTQCPRKTANSSTSTSIPITACWMGARG